MHKPLEEQVRILKTAVRQLMAGDCELAIDTLVEGGFDPDDENFGYDEGD